jgi:hypothetical protein
MTHREPHACEETSLCCSVRFPAPAPDFFGADVRNDESWSDRGASLGDSEGLQGVLASEGAG